MTAVRVFGEGPFHEAVCQALAREGFQAGAGADASFALAANLRRKLPAQVLRQYPGGVWGYHPSLLPRHRGPDAVNATVDAGDAVAGGSVYRFTEELDAGPLLSQDWCFVLPGETARQLYRRALFPMGVRLLLRAARSLGSGSTVRTWSQDERFTTVHGRRNAVATST